MIRSRLFAALLALAPLSASFVAPVRTDAALSSAQRTVLQRYVAALARGRYDTAFALLSNDERRYFGSSTHLASVYAADRFKIDKDLIIESKTTSRGTLAIVLERFEFFDHANQVMRIATAKVPYGIVRNAHALRIADRLHPWRAYAPETLAGTTAGVRVLLRKVSFFTGRLEIVATFQNLGPVTVTLLPYGKTLLRDQNGHVYELIASRLPSLTDPVLYTGLRLAPSKQYTGVLVFATPDRFEPTDLALTVGPALADGGDAPFQIVVPPLSIPG